MSSKTHGSRSKSSRPFIWTTPAAISSSRFLAAATFMASASASCTRRYQATLRYQAICVIYTLLLVCLSNHNCITLQIERDFYKWDFCNFDLLDIPRDICMESQVSTIKVFLLNPTRRKIHIAHCPLVSILVDHARLDN